MRIISKFQDYYDSALAYGFENDRVLVRHNQTWDKDGQGSPNPTPVSPVLQKLQDLCKEAPPFHDFGEPYRHEKRPKNAHMQITPMVFCVGGRVTKALWVLDVQSVRLNRESRYHQLNRDSRYNQNVYLPQLNPAHQHTAPTNFEPHPTDTVRHDGPVFTAKEFKDATASWREFYETSGNQEAHHAYGTKHGVLERLQKWLDEPALDMYVDAIAQEVSVAVALREAIAVNPCLKDWKFFKYWDAATCMQEISMFVGNMSAPDAKPVVMDDKFRVQSHGFDDKSFRKQPTKHGLPKRAKRPHPDTPQDNSSDPTP